MKQVAEYLDVSTAIVYDLCAPPPLPDASGRRFTLSLSVFKNQVFKVWQVLQAISDRSKNMTVKIQIEAEAQDRFDPVWLRNAVEEPLDEADIKRG